MSSKGGPISREGKEVVRKNSVKHGLTAESLIALDSFEETISDYEEIAIALKASIKPRNFLETALIEKMAKSLFKSRRLDYLESRSFQDCDELFSQIDPSQKGGIELNENHLDLMLRYQTALENQFHKSLQAIVSIRQPQQLSIFEGKEPKND